jgi:hypothetical protein
MDTFPSTFTCDNLLKGQNEHLQQVAKELRTEIVRYCKPPATLPVLIPIHVNNQVSGLIMRELEERGFSCRIEESRTGINEYTTYLVLDRR